MKSTRTNGGGSVAAATVISIDTGRVRPFADQPREYFDAGELISLELSIKQRGQLQPAMVRRLTGDRDHDYELVDGQRRWHACSKLAIPLRAMIIDPANPEDQFEISVAANFQRAEHTPMEIAKAIERMCTQGRRSTEYVGTLFGKSQAWVITMRRLVNLAPEIQELLNRGVSGNNPLQTVVAMELARLPIEQQRPTLEDIQARQLTTSRAVDKIRRLVAEGTGEPERKKKPSSHAKNLESFVRATIQRADLTLDRMGPDDLRIVTANLVQTKKYDTLRETIMTAIGRLEVIHRRLTECRAVLASQTAPTAAAPKSEPLRAKTAKEPTHIYSHAMRCPKCNNVARFKRRSDADPQKDYWTCDRNGCQLKISHYNIKVDRSYGQGLAAGA